MILQHIPTEDRRSNYRVDLEEKSSIEVRILAEGGKSIVARVHTVSSGGIGVHLPSELASFLFVSQKVQVEFGGGPIVKPLTVRAIVKHHLPEKGLHRYGLEFVDRQSFDEELLNRALHGLFNRRGAYRVRPESGAKIPVLLQSQPQGVRGSGIMADISVTGIGLVVTPDVEAQFRGIDRFILSFRLPGILEAVTLDGILRYRTLDKDEVRCGLVFDPRRSDQFRRQEAAILEYVMRRQREILARRMS